MSKNINEFLEIKEKAKENFRLAFDKLLNTHSDLLDRAIKRNKCVIPSPSAEGEWNNEDSKGLLGCDLIPKLMDMDLDGDYDDQNRFDLEEDDIINLEEE